MTQTMPVSPTIALAQDLMGRASVTPEDKGCQELMIARLEAIGFTIERMRFGEVDNFWARRGTEKPVLAFAGHTDVVPSGPHSVIVIGIGQRYDIVVHCDQDPLRSYRAYAMVAL